MREIYKLQDETFLNVARRHPELRKFPEDRESDTLISSFFGKVFYLKHYVVKKNILN